jgi:putative glutamine amidotransferase
MIAVATSPFIHSIKNKFNCEVEVADLNKLDEYKLIIFTGGADISPWIYGEKNKYSNCSINRDNREIEVFYKAIEKNKKVLGICRGHQLINALLGGKLIQDLYKDLKSRHGGGHKLNKIQDGVIPYIFRDVNSLHHQGVIVPGENLIPTTTYNGVIESTESENIVSVQFHPEFMNDYQSKDFWNWIKDWIKDE